MVATIPSFLACWFAPFHHDDSTADAVPAQSNNGVVHEA
jgi:hypothetical protein